MDNKASPRGQCTPAGKRAPNSMDEMSLGEFLEILRRWAALSGSERRAILLGPQQTLH
jgi:hypothetical protein